MRNSIEKTNERVSKWYVTRNRINTQGYDSAGVYWGNGTAVWMVMSEDGAESLYVRGYNRECAKEAVVREYPEINFKFFR